MSIYIYMHKSLSLSLSFSFFLGAMPSPVTRSTVHATPQAPLLFKHPLRS